MYDMIDPLPGALRLKMPSFTVAWTIVDVVMVSLRALEFPFLLAALLLLEMEPAAMRSRLILVIALELATVVLIAVSGLIGDIALLCRRHWSLWFCFTSVIFTLLSYGILIWQSVLLYSGRSAMVLSCLIIGVTLFIMLRTALLVFNVISLCKAVGFFRERDGY